MSVTAKWYGKAQLGQYGNTAARRVDFTADTIKVAIATSSYVPDQDAHDFFDDITNEITGTGYSAGGVTLASTTVTYDSASNETRLDAADASWSSSTFTGRYAIIYKSTGVAGTSPLMGYVDFGADQSVSAGTFSLVWDSTGVLKTTVS